MRTLITTTRTTGDVSQGRTTDVPYAGESLLSVLRSVTPQRSLHMAEALRIAELQANKLRAFFGLDDGAVPSEVVTRQPRVRLVFDEVLEGAASGSSHWDGLSWVIALNPREATNRQRFSLFHEYKHIIDDRFRGVLYQGEKTISAADKAERVADYFAAAVLMPKRLVKRYYCSGVNRLSDLAEMFEVSEQAMHVRLRALGLLPRPDPHRARMVCRPTTRASVVGITASASSGSALFSFSPAHPHDRLTRRPL